jgi:hypothetical protein
LKPWDPPQNIRAADLLRVIRRRSASARFFRKPLGASSSYEAEKSSQQVLKDSKSMLSPGS